MDSRKILEIYKRINDRRPKPVSEFPSIDDIPLGMVVLDSDGVVNKKIVVANLDGADIVSFPFTLPENRTTGPFELEFLMSIDGMPTYYVPFVSMVDAARAHHWRMQVDSAVPNAITSVWRTSAGSTFTGRSSFGFIDGRWHKHRIVVTSDLIGRYFVDDVQQGADSYLSSWVPGAATSFQINGTTASGTKTFTKISSMKVSRNGVVLAIVPFSDGAGATCRDISGNGNYGAISDVYPVTFWDSSLVPVSLLS